MVFRYDYTSLLFSIAFFAVFGIVITGFIFTFIKIFKEGVHNNRSPLLTVSASVVAKRTATRIHGSAGSDAQMYSTSSYSRYYVTFQVESGDRLELSVPENEYGYIVEGDTGRLSFKGTKFIGFERER